MANKTADDLLKWGLANSGDAAQQSIAALGEQIESGQRPDLADPGLYQKIMGTSEADMMKEQLTVAANPANDETDRATALDNFEMLVESIDNANLMENMQMWPVFLKLLSDPSDKVQLGATWVVGTAVQNNDKAQMVVYKHGFIPALLTLLQNSSSDQVRSKVAYALSGVLKNNPAAIRSLDDLDSSGASGWVALSHGLQDPSIQLRRKITFLLYNLLLQDVSPHDEEAELPSSTAAPAPAPAHAISSAPTSGSTALSLTAHSSSPAPAVDPAAPLEKGPATSGVPYPDVPLRLAKAGVIQVLASSLLPSGADLPDGAYYAVTNAGPDADQEPRLDLDYAEKVSRTLAQFSQNVAGRKSTTVRQQISSTLFTAQLLRAVVTALQGPSPHGSTGAWYSSVGLEPEEWTAFQQRVQSL